MKEKKTHAAGMAQRPYVDFYTYLRSAHPRAVLTQAFLRCVPCQLQPKVDHIYGVKEQTWGRAEQRISLSVTSPICTEQWEQCMKAQGYQRYQDYNFYEHLEP